MILFKVYINQEYQWILSEKYLEKYDFMEMSNNSYK